MRYAGFFVLLFTAGENLSFFMTADDIDDGNLFFFKGKVENIGDDFLIIDGVNENVVDVVLAVDIDGGLVASIFVISCSGGMFEFIDVFMVSATYHLSSWVVKCCSALTLFAAW